MGSLLFQCHEPFIAHFLGFFCIETAVYLVPDEANIDFLFHELFNVCPYLLRRPYPVLFGIRYVLIGSYEVLQIPVLLVALTMIEYSWAGHASLCHVRWTPRNSTNMEWAGMIQQMVCSQWCSTETRIAVVTTVGSSRCGFGRAKLLCDNPQSPEVDDTIFSYRNFVKCEDIVWKHTSIILILVLQLL